MRKVLFITAILSLFLLVPLNAMSSEFSLFLEKIEDLLEKDENQKAITQLNINIETSDSPETKGALLWRRSRAEFSKTDLEFYLGLLEKSEAIGEFEEAQASADQAIDILQNYKKSASSASTAQWLAKELAQAYFWKCATIGIIGQMKGVVNSLFRAADMRDILKQSVLLDPDFSNNYYILGQLYEQLPGWPLSFGNKDEAVSFGRAAVFFHEQNLAVNKSTVRYYDYYTELARHLRARNWSNEKRLKEQRKKMSAYSTAENDFEKMKYFEASKSLTSLSDREESAEILLAVISNMKKSGQQTTRLKRDLAKAEELAADWDIEIR